MTNKSTSSSKPNSMRRVLEKNNKLIKGNMKMNAELIEAISNLSKAVEGLEPRNSSSASTMETDNTSVLPVHLYMLLDRSGSMSGWEQDVIGGFNTFIKEQQKEKDDCSVTLVQFDGQAPYEVIIDAQDLSTVTELAPNVYRPRGNTPLLDALGRMIKNAEKSEAKQAEDVLVWVFTDGLENASREFTYEQIKALVAEKEKAGWTFMFMGAGIDSYRAGRSLGFSDDNVSNFHKSAEGIDAAYMQFDRSLSSYRGKPSRSERLAQKRAMWEGRREAEDFLTEES
tara:strand:- start:887 stop:1738 length:852 start_codon:yes stop_codon:yes gene_type:complete